MEENNDIFLAGSNTLMYFGKPMYKKDSTTFASAHLLSTYISDDKFFNPSPPVHIFTHFGWLPPFFQLRTYLMDGLFLNQKQIRTLEYRIHWNINIRKKIIYEKVNDSVVWNKHSGKQY